MKCRFTDNLRNPEMYIAARQLMYRLRTKDGGTTSGSSIETEKKTSGIPLEIWSCTHANEELYKTIKEYQAVATKQTRALIRLTHVIVALTLVMSGRLVVQI